jgi:glutamine synthetase
MTALGATELRARGVELVACAFVDYAGIARTFCFPAERLDSATTSGVGASTAFAGFQGDDIYADVHIDGVNIRETDLRLFPDLDSLAGGPDGWGWVAVDQIAVDGTPWPLCPRQFLRRQVDELDRAGLELRAAFELEWYGERLADGEPLHRQPAYGLATLRDVGPYLRVIAERLRAHGVTFEKIHPEYVVGQVETSLTPAAPLRACDDQVLARYVIRGAQSETGVRASFSPIANAGSLGTGLHLHFSCWDGSENLFGVGPEPFGMTRVGRAFLAGVLRDVRGIMALAGSCPLSYRRVGPSLWVGGYSAWGVDNREAALRLIRGWHASRPGASHVEVRPIDGTANPYLLVGAVIATGLAGIRDGLELPDPVVGDPALLSDEERQRSGIALMPSNLEEAASAIESSDVLCSALGPLLVDAISRVRRGTAASSASRTTEELIDFYRWRY